MFQENSIETCILSRVKQITGPGWKHETSARTWCPGRTWREWVGRELGGGIGMGKTCEPKAFSFQCMTKFTTKKKKRERERDKAYIFQTRRRQKRMRKNIYNQFKCKKEMWGERRKKEKNIKKQRAEKSESLKYYGKINPNMSVITIYLHGLNSIVKNIGCHNSFLKNFCIFIWLPWVLVEHAGSFSYNTQTLSCILWDQVPWPGIKPRPPALGAWSLSHWTTREVSRIAF